MEKENNKFIAVAYKLYSLADGKETLIEEAPADRPFVFITGFGITLDAFENGVEDLPKGEQFTLNIECEEAYGERLDERVLDLNKEIFTINGHFDHDNIYKDAVVPLQNEDGNRFMGRVLDVTEDTVKMDLNHPLAGLDLLFKGEIVENREATNEEVQQMLNHISGEGGCGGCGCGHNHGDEEGGGHEHGGCCGHEHHGDGHEHGHHGGCCSHGNGHHGGGCGHH
ncbi:peptidylprolyl isomerase [Prevotella sp. oral taxon 317]|jgi:peptidyl-prolyl cis-trans isomerase|uniref:FKBP-type peptidyl-prolyl cis-trans isomerase n=1 Tax=Prevotella sp. oral taxon 317 TaxID=652721 RepID=UPI0001C3F2EF|nr:FKBP-type peptidyl-prolyl cis-trans isomerase [Prevotella sp. oral taxon 317]EFC69961.1 peptidyl-prolyl cis-trans isomerase SlyD, FKBP-type [Prevotella sp. oral taxon 317 str. F0108]